MAKKLPVYMWEPLFNRLTRISTEYAHKVLGIIPSSLTRYIQNKTYNQKLECYFVREPLSVKEKRQRDELINDMAEAKRKAEAFDEIAVTVLSEDNDVIKNMNNIVTKIVINNLECDSDE